MFTLDELKQCEIGGTFDGNLTMDIDDGVPVYLRDPNAGERHIDFINTFKGLLHIILGKYWTFIGYLLEFFIQIRYLEIH